MFAILTHHNYNGVTKYYCRLKNATLRFIRQAMAFFFDGNNHGIKIAGI